MRIAAAFAAAAFVVLFGATVHAQSPSGISGVVAPGVEPELLQEGFIFTEGPVGTPDGGLPPYCYACFFWPSSRAFSKAKALSLSWPRGRTVSLLV